MTLDGGYPAIKTSGEPPKGLSDYRHGPAEEPQDAQEQDDGIEIEEGEPVDEEEEQEVEGEESEETEESEEQEEGEDEESEPEDEPQSPKGQRRVQKLANKVREKEKENDDLKALISTLRSKEERELSEMEQRRHAMELERQALAPQYKVQHMQQLRMNPEDPVHHFAYDTKVENEVLKTKLEGLEQKLEAILNKDTKTSFQRELEQETDKVLSGYKLDPEVKKAVLEAAEETALARKVSPSEAAKLVARRFAPVLKPRKAKKGEDVREAVTAINTSGRTGGAKPGSKQKPSFMDMLRALPR